jgi:hypothetical protein
VSPLLKLRKTLGFGKTWISSRRSYAPAKVQSATASLGNLLVCSVVLLQLGNAETQKFDHRPEQTENPSASSLPNNHHVRSGGSARVLSRECKESLTLWRLNSAVSSHVFSRTWFVMVKPRISLRTLFVLATLLIVFFGYSQLRRQRMLRHCNDLSRAEIVVVLPESWRDRIWQRTPLAAVVHWKHTLSKSEERIIDDLGIDKRHICFTTPVHRASVIENIRDGIAWLPDNEYQKAMESKKSRRQQ